MSKHLRVKRTRRIRKNNISPAEVLTPTVNNHKERRPPIEDVRTEIENLPKPRFTRIPSPEENEDDEEVEQVVFERPDNHYIRYIEPTENDLFERVEYDMDEQDRVYLELLNQGRRKKGLSNITPYIFESIIDRLEKEWYNLVKDLPNKASNQDDSNADVPAEDSACAICDDTEVENSNAIVFCDGCNLAVHQDCYGIPYIPEGQWLCRKCMISPDKPVSCLFCPNEGGAFKQTQDNQWGHLLCAIWIPELSVSNTVYMEPIARLEEVPKNRLKLCCYICKKKQGACIQCDNKYCFTAFHVTCARSVKLCMRISHDENGISLKAFCDKHTPKDYEHTPQALEENIENAKTMKKKSNKEMTVAETKAARAYQHQYSTGIPIAPDEILGRLDQLQPLKEFRTKQKQQIVNDISHYWSLKREERRGTPLIKRLHLEPWTASANSSQSPDQTSLHAAKLRLRIDLEKIRLLAERVKKRENLKLIIARKQAEYLESIFFPMDNIMLDCLEQFMLLDKNGLFISDSEEEVSEHSLTAIHQKLTEHVYKEMDEFKEAVSQVWEHVLNDSQQHHKRTAEYRLAQRLKAAAPQLFQQAEEDWSQMKLMPDTTMLNIPVHDAIFDYDRGPSEFPVEDWDKMEEEQKAREEAERLKKQKQEEAKQAAEKKREKEAAERKARREAADKRAAERKAAALERQKSKGKGVERTKNSTTTPVPTTTTAFTSSQDTQTDTTSSQHIPTNSSHPINTSISKFTSTSKIPAKRSRYGPPIKRTTRSEGLNNSVNELVLKSTKMSSEARLLYNSYIGASALSRKQPTFREDKKRHAPAGWVYVKSDNDDDEDDDDEEEEIDIVSDASEKASDQTTTEKDTPIYADISTDEPMMVDEVMEEVEQEKEEVEEVEEEEEDGEEEDGEEEDGEEEDGVEEDGEEEAVVEEGDDEEDDESTENEVNSSKIRFIGKILPKGWKPLKHAKPGDIVWTRLRRHPFHPAKILEEGEAPSSVQSAKVLRTKFPERIPVNYLNIEGKHQWKRVEDDCIFKLGDASMDEAFLLSVIAGKWGHLDQRIDDLIGAYKMACEALDIDPKPVLRNVIRDDPRRKNALTESIL